jgi:hypothetical protein
MKSSHPHVSGPPTTKDGRYALGRQPIWLAPHNERSWRIIASMLEAYETAQFWDLAAAVRDHKHGARSATTPQTFVRYCINSGWLRRVSK